MAQSRAGPERADRGVGVRTGAVLGLRSLFCGAPSGGKSDGPDGERR